MRRFIATLAAASLMTGAAMAGGIMTTPQRASALTVDQSTAAYTSLLDAFWDQDARYFTTYSDRVVHPEHAVGPSGGRYSDYWWEAQLWSGVQDRYAATGDADARAKIDEIYDGFRAAYPDFSANDYNDDIGWWAAGAIRAYELTGEQRFLDASEDFYGYISRFEDTTYGGGIWWKNDILDGDHNEKNVATNGTAIQTALRLYHATGDTNYRAQAFRLYGWLKATFDRDGRIRDNVSHDGEFKDYDFTYDQGQFAGAALQMHLVTGDRAYLTDATRAADWAVANLTVSGVFRDEGQADGGGFKAILTRVLRALIDDAGQTQYQSVLTLNASQAANHVNARGLGGSDWNSPAPETPIQSIVAGSSAAVQQQARPDGVGTPIEGTRVYPAENVVATGIPSASALAGYQARGYLDWAADPGSRAVFPINAARTADRVIRIRYQSSDGGVRMLEAGSCAPVAVAFPATASGTWGEVDVTVPLTTGFTAVTLSVDGGGSGTLALDGLTLDR